MLVDDTVNENGDNFSNQYPNIWDVFDSIPVDSNVERPANDFEDWWMDWKSVSFASLDQIFTLNTLTFHQIPQTVNNLSAVADSSTQVTISWNEPSNQALPIICYKIEKGIPTGFLTIVVNHPLTIFTNIGFSNNSNFFPVLLSV